MVEDSSSVAGISFVLFCFPLMEIMLINLFSSFCTVTFTCWKVFHWLNVYKQPFSHIVLDTAAGVWCDTKSVVTSPRTGRYSADAAGGDAAVELTRRCRHAAAAVGDLIFIYGGLRGGKK